MRIWHSGPEIGKNLDKSIKFLPLHIFSNLIEDKGKMTLRKTYRKKRIRTVTHIYIKRVVIFPKNYNF